MDALSLLWFAGWFLWSLPAAVADDYGTIRRSNLNVPRLWALRMALWANLDAGWKAATGRLLK